LETKELGVKETKPLTFRVQRYDPDQDREPYLQDFTVPAYDGMTVLEGLWYIKEHLDGSLAFRSSCRMGICGSCGMYINKFPRLACHTQTFELHAEVIEVKSLPNYGVVRDLVPDLRPMLDKHRSIKPYIMRPGEEDEVDHATGEYLQTPEQLESFLQFAYCLKCGICMAACPTVATDREFLGPQPLGQTYRYNADNRDDASAARLSIIDSPHGVWRCHMAGACSDACPKGVDPALAIQLLKKQSVKQALGIGRKEERAKIVGSQAGAQRRPNIPEAPPRTI